MKERELSRELEKMRVDQQQWRDEYVQREHHWARQHLFWGFISGVSLLTLAIRIAMYFAERVA